MDTSPRQQPQRRNPDAPASRVQVAVEVEIEAAVIATPAPSFEPPVSMLAPMFLRRLDRIHDCRVAFKLDINTRATSHVLGGYYKSRRLVRIYTHDSKDGRRPLNELFDTFLHEVAHHLEYTEPQSFGGKVCNRIPGRMHSRLFWRILGELKYRWAEVKAQHHRNLME